LAVVREYRIGTSLAIAIDVERWKGSSEEIDSLIERFDDMRRESERTRSYVSERLSSRPFWPDRRRNPRVPEPANSGEGSSNEAA
jgi:hypothetical protein